MGHLDVATVSYTLPDGRPLLRNVAFSLGTGEQVAVVGANGAGKSTLLRIVMGQLSPDSGIVTCDGNFGVMGQFITGRTVKELLLSVSPPEICVAVIPCGLGGRHNRLSATSAGARGNRTA